MIDVLLIAAVLSTAPDINELATPADQILKSLPGVESVEVIPAKTQRKRRVIHLLNWHFVPREQYEADLNGLRDEPLTNDESFKEFQKFRDEVEAVQQEQIKLLHVLIRKHGLKKLFCEGLAVEETEKYRSLLATLKRSAKYVNRGDSPIDLLVQHEYQNDILMIGAPGRLMMNGELNDVLPTETQESLKTGAPFDAEGSVKFDDSKIEQREDVIVEHLMKGGPVSFVVLGGAHDLSDNIPDDCEYIRVATMKYAVLARKPD